MNQAVQTNSRNADHAAQSAPELSNQAHDLDPVVDATWDPTDPFWFTRPKPTPPPVIMGRLIMPPPKTPPVAPATPCDPAAADSAPSAG